MPTNLISLGGKVYTHITAAQFSAKKIKKLLVLCLDEILSNENSYGNFYGDSYGNRACYLLVINKNSIKVTEALSEVLKTYFGKNKVELDSKNYLMCIYRVYMLCSYYFKNFRTDISNFQDAKKWFATFNNQN